MEWVSVKDRLPETEGRYLVFLPDEEERKIACANWETWEFNGHKKSTFVVDECDYIKDRVGAWMPLPEPYNGVL